MTQISSPSAAYRPTHGGYPNPTVEEAAESKSAPACQCSSGILGFPVHREGCPAATPDTCPRCVAVDPEFRDYTYSGVV